MLPSLAYNAGRVMSYTIIGGLVGALGPLISLSATLKGAMPVFAAVRVEVMAFRPSPGAGGRCGR